MEEIHLNVSSMRSLFIEMYFGKTRLSSGTAFVVKVGGQQGLVTNRHNLTGRHQATGQPLSGHGGVPDQIVVWHNADTEVPSWVPITMPLYADDGEALWLEHPGLGARADIAVLLLNQIESVKFLAYDLDIPPELIQRPADSVSVIGFPFGKASAGLLAIWATGFIASEPDFPFDGMPITLIDCRSRPGQSGSPVVMQRNDVYWSEGRLMSPYTRAGKTQLIGIYSGRISSESDIGMVWWASAIRETLEQSVTGSFQEAGISD